MILLALKLPIERPGSVASWRIVDCLCCLDPQRLSHCRRCILIEVEQSLRHTCAKLRNFVALTSPSPNLTSSPSWTIFGSGWPALILHRILDSLSWPCCSGWPDWAVPPSCSGASKASPCFNSSWGNAHSGLCWKSWCFSAIVAGFCNCRVPWFSETLMTFTEVPGALCELVHCLGCSFWFYKETLVAFGRLGFAFAGSTSSCWALAPPKHDRYWLEFPLPPESGKEAYPAPSSFYGLMRSPSTGLQALLQGSPPSCSFCDWTQRRYPYSSISPQLVYLQKPWTLLSFMVLHPTQLNPYNYA